MAGGFPAGVVSTSSEIAGVSKVVNLRQARKAAAREKAKAAADENAARHGQTKAQRGLAKAQAEKLARALEAHRIERRDD